MTDFLCVISESAYGGNSKHKLNPDTVRLCVWLSLGGQEYKRYSAWSSEGIFVSENGIPRINGALRIKGGTMCKV